MMITVSALAGCSTAQLAVAPAGPVYQLQVRLPIYMTGDELGAYVAPGFKPAEVPGPDNQAYRYAVIRNIRGDSALNAIRQELLQTGIPLQNLVITHE